MSLIPFTSQLTPTNKIGELLFWDDLSETIFSATYSRTNINSTSGTTVFNENGNIVQLANNEPTWNFPLDGSCPYLVMRPTLQNIWDQTEPITSSPTTIVSINWGYNLPFTTAHRLIVSNIFKTIPQVAIGNVYTICLFARKADLSFPIVNIGNNPENDFSIEIGNQLWRNFERNLIEEVGDGIYFLMGTAICGPLVSVTGVRKRDSQSTVNVDIAAISLFEGDLFDQIKDYKGFIHNFYVPSTGGQQLTRPPDLFELTGLTTKHMVDTNGMFTYTANILWRDMASEVDILKFQNSAGVDQLTLRSKVGGNLVLTYFNGTSLIEIGSGVPADALSNIGITYDETTLIFSVGGITDSKVNVSLDTIDKLICPSNNRYIEFHNKLYTAFSPFMLSENVLNYVTSNAESLSAFTQQFGVAAPSYFGIDAICIDNTINKLKAGQIPMYDEAANYINTSKDNGYIGGSISQIRKYLIQSGLVN